MDGPHRAPTIHDIGRKIRRIPSNARYSSTFDHCPYRETNRIGRVRYEKYKCYGCRKEWGPRLGSIVEELRVPLVRVLIAIKLSE